MKKWLCARLALALMGLSALALAEEENLLQNGDFSEGDGELPDGWRREMWLTDAGIVNRCYCLRFPELPLRGNYDENKYNGAKNPWEYRANYTMKGKDWERPARFTMFDNGEKVIDQNVGISFGWALQGMPSTLWYAVITSSTFPFCTSSLKAAR